MATTKEFFSKEDLKFLETYLNTYSPTGFEAEGQKVWLDYLKPAIDEYHVDNYGTVYGVVNPKADFKVVIEAHADEISWYVANITSDGLLYVRRNGGSDHQIAPSMRVWIHTEKGKIPGVFGWPAIHLRKGATGETPAKVENIFVDCGCISAEEVKEKGIHPGTIITFQDGFFTLNDRYFGGRALDNRMGGFMIAKVARLIKEGKHKLPFGLYIVNSVQEEVGLHGAYMVAHTINPNCAIITDVSHDTSTPMIDKNVDGDYKCGKGPVLTIAPAVHNKLLGHLRSTATKHNIPFQLDAASRSSGTDTDAWAYTRGGIPSALISLPLRYMHTTVEMVAKEDVENVIKLMKESVLSLTPNFNFKYL
ncbi:MAG: M42 family metallopeptidase [Chitinophagales bacterium]|nr:M42 family metallopeptidase [Chitinophagales bacterium]MCO5280801.1 M42 family metallopeptidase [Chitinophagales bacterium]HRN93212.1 M42 family metallopeptidase [Chitinophagales bacterium]HRP39537.1 M42 family metallopeptidase [Chitinophagales bacterium]